MKRQLVVALAGVVAFITGCGSGGAIRVEVTTTESRLLVAHCFVLEVVRGAQVLGSTQLSLSADKRLYTIGIKQGRLPKTIGVRASAYLGDCAVPAARQLASQSRLVEATFPAEGVLVVPLGIEPPDADLDADRDGYVAVGRGGADCDDSDENIRPNTRQACGVVTDTDCDGQVGCADADCAAEPLCARPPTRLAMNPASATSLPDECSPIITLETRDATGPAPVALPTRVTVTGSLGVSIFGDATCTTPLSTLDFPVGSMSAGFHYRAERVGTSSIVASAPSLAPGTFDIRVNPFPVASLVYSAGPNSVGAGVCSEPFTVELRDASQHPTTAGAAFPVGLSSDFPNGLAFHPDDASCATPLPSPETVTVPVGSGAVSFRIRGTRAGRMTLTARASPSVISATRPLTVTPGAPARLAFTSGDPGTQVNQCSAPVTLELRDSFGNPAMAAAPLAITLSSSSTNFRFYGASDSSCASPVTAVTLSAGASSASVRALGALSGVYTMTASAAGLDPAVQTATVARGPPERIRIVSNPVTAVAGVCALSAVRLQTQDSSGAPSAVASALTLVLSGGTVSWFADSSCTTPLPGGSTVMAAGTSETNAYFRGTRAQTFTAAVGASGPFTGTHSLAGFGVSAAAPHHLAWQSPQSRTIRAAECSLPFQLLVLDPFDNRTSYAVGQTLNLSSTPAGVRFASGAGCSGAGTSVPVSPQTELLTLHATATEANTYRLAGSVGAVGSVDPQATLVVDAGTPTQLVYTTRPPATAAAGDCLTARLELRDAQGNPSPASPGTVVTLSTGTSTFDFYRAGQCPTGTPTTSVDFTAGQSSVPFGLLGRAVQTYTVTASAGALVASPPAPTITVSAGAATALRFGSLLSSYAAGDCAQSVAVERVDAFNNPTTVPPGPLNVTVAGSGGGLGFFSTPSACSGGPSNPLTVMIPSGQTLASFALVGTVVTTNASISASASGVAPVAGTVAITPGPAVTLGIEGNGGSLEAGTCSSNLTVRSHDQYGNHAPVSGDTTLTPTHNGGAGTVTFFTNSSCTSSIPPASLIISSSTDATTFSFRATQVNPAVTLTVSAGGFTPGSQQWTITAAPAHQLVWESSPPSTLTRFACSGPLTVGVLDALGNPTSVSSPTTVNLISNSVGAGAVFFASTDCTGTGRSSLSLSPGSSGVSFSMVLTGSGPTTVSVADTASPNGLLPTPGVQVTPTGAAGTLAVTATSTDIEYFDCQPVVVTRRNPSPAPWSSGTTNWTVTIPGSDNVSLYTTSSCSGAIAASVNGTIDDGASSATLYVGGRSGAPTTVVLAAVDAWGGFATGTLQVNALPLVRRGTCTIAAAATSVSCPVTPAIPGNDISRTFMLFQATTSAAGASEAAVACWLQGGGSVAVDCSRYGTGVAVPISWQTATWGRGFSLGGVTVQHLDGPLLNTDPLEVVVPVNSVTTTSSFLLFSSKSVGTNNNADDFVTARLTSATTVSITNSIAWQTPVFPATEAFHYSLQVVQLAGANVLRGRELDRADAGVSVTVPSGATNRLVNFHTVRHGATNNTAQICKRRYRGVVQSATVLSYTRGASATGPCVDSPADELAWERIELPVGALVFPAAVTINNMNTSGTASLAQPPVPHRTLLLMAGQGPGGQASGETNVSSSSDLGFAHAILSLSGATLTVTRGAAQGGSRSEFAPMVVTLSGP